MDVVLRSGDTSQLVCQRDIKLRFRAWIRQDLSLSHVLSVTRTRDEFLPVRGEAGVALMMGSAGPIVLGHALVLPWIEAIVGSQLRYPYWHPRLFSISIYFDTGKDEASRAKSMRI
jgi:hypothetical protein